MQDLSRFKAPKHLEHVKLRPTIYIGSVDNVEGEVLIIDEEKKVEYKTLHVNQGLVKTVFEIIDNAIDNIYRDPPCKNILVEVNKDGSMRVCNDGQHIPVQVPDEETEYLPTILFGRLMSGSNFDDTDRKSIGCNGVGASLTNIFSSRFHIICRDPIAEQEFQQEWVDQMNTVNPFKMKKLKKNYKWSTEVTWTPKLDCFTCDLDGFFKNVVPLVYTRLVELSCTLDKDVKVSYKGPDATRPVLLKGFNFKTLVKMHEDTHVYEKVNDKFEYGLCKSRDDKYMHNSYVNNQPTTDPNSSHTKYVTQVVVNMVKKELDKSFKDNKINTNVIRQKLHVFVNMRLNAPQFSTQNKEKLTNKITASDYPIDEAKLKRLLNKSGIIDSLKAALQKNSLAELSKALTSGKKRNVVIDKLVDANRAGTVSSNECTLMLTEGDSAMTMVRIGLSVVGQDYFGGFPLRGKLINVNNKADLTKNEEIKNIVKILGLDYRKKYLTKEEINTLRYGKVAIMTDQDVDGSHITGLVVNMFNKFWPNLLKVGYLQKFVTPYVRAFPKKGDSLDFYSMKDYDEWAKNVDTSKYKVKTYKGLGTSVREDSVGYFKNIKKHLKTLEVDDKTSDVIDKVFNPDKRDDRKTWLESTSTQYKPLDYNDTKFNVTQMFETELLDYSRYSIQRAIPSLVDGMKTSNRQIMHTCFKFLPKNSEMKVAQLASLVALKTEYVHGEQSLVETIIGMAQKFCGSNNVPLLNDVGAFGTRGGGKSKMIIGKDHASGRYIFTSMSPEIDTLLFNEYDRAVVDYRVVEGTTVEPHYFVPNIPLCLVNQMYGLATGFRSAIPSFNPLDLIHNIRVAIGQPGEPKKLIPWYRNFGGDIVETSANTWTISGKFSVDGREVTITEIPVSFGANVVSIGKYKSMLDKMKEKGVLTTILCNHVDENTPKFTVTMAQALPTDVAERDAFIRKTFKLDVTVNTNSFYLLDQNGVPCKFDSPESILAKWLEIKLIFMERRKAHILYVLTTELERLKAQLIFVDGVIDGSIVVAKRTKADIVSQMEAKQILNQYHDMLLAMPVSSLGIEKRDRLAKQVQDLQEKIYKIEKTTSKQLYIDDLDQLETWLKTLDTRVETKGTKRKKSSSSKKKKQMKL